MIFLNKNDFLIDQRKAKEMSKKRSVLFFNLKKALSLGLS